MYIYWKNPVLVAGTNVCCARRPANRYRAARQPHPPLPPVFQGLKYEQRAQAEIVLR